MTNPADGGADSHEEKERAGYRPIPALVVLTAKPSTKLAANPARGGQLHEKELREEVARRHHHSAHQTPECPELITRPVFGAKFLSVRRLPPGMQTRERKHARKKRCIRHGLAAGADY